MLIKQRANYELLVTFVCGHIRSELKRLLSSVYERRFKVFAKMNAGLMSLDLVNMS